MSNQEQTISLNYIVILNEYPFYVLSHDEKSAIKISERYSSTLLCIGVSDTGISLMKPQIKTTLEHIETKSMPIYSVDGEFVEEVTDVNYDDLDDDEKKILEVDTHRKGNKKNEKSNK